MPADPSSVEHASSLVVASHYEQTGRDLAALGYTVGQWTEEVRHAEPCDCNLDEEEAGERCMANSRSYWALMLDEGAHGWSMAFPLDRDLVEALRDWFDADDGSIAERQVARVRLHEAWYAARRVAPCRYCDDTGIIGAESNPGRSHCSECSTGRALIEEARRRRGGTSGGADS
jgi:hypothetical protein